MKVIIAGPRSLDLDYDTITKAVDASGFDIAEVVTGGARGVDYSARRWAIRYNFALRQFFPDWKAAEEMGNRRAAGPIRNRKMAEYADALIIIRPKGKTSRGTESMLSEAWRAGLPFYAHDVSTEITA